MIEASKAFNTMFIFVLIVISVLVIQKSSVSFARAGISSVGIARSFTTTGNCGSRTPAWIEYEKTPGNEWDSVKPSSCVSHSSAPSLLVWVRVQAEPV
jgi:hypothetical protein